MFGISAAPVALAAATHDVSAYTDQAVQLGLRLAGALLVLLVGMWVARRLANFGSIARRVDRKPFGAGGEPGAACVATRSRSAFPCCHRRRYPGRI
jgi:hypothetical protein